MASLEFLGCFEAALDDVFLHSQNPALVIRSTEISNWRQLFLRKARMVDTPGTGVAHGSLHSEDAPLPLSVEHRLVLFDLDFAEAVHTAHVVHAVHQRTRRLGHLRDIWRSCVSAAVAGSDTVEGRERRSRKSASF